MSEYLSGIRVKYHNHNKARNVIVLSRRRGDREERLPDIGWISWMPRRLCSQLPTPKNCTSTYKRPPPPHFPWLGFMVFCHSSSSFFLCSVNAAKCFEGIINGNHILALEYSEIFGSNSLSVWNRGRARSSKIEHIHHIQLNLARHKSFSTNLYYILGKCTGNFKQK